MARELALYFSHSEDNIMARKKRKQEKKKKKFLKKQNKPKKKKKNSTEKKQKDECRVSRVAVDDPTEAKPPTFHRLQDHRKGALVWFDIEPPGHG